MYNCPYFISTLCGSILLCESLSLSLSLFISAVLIVFYVWNVYDVDYTFCLCVYRVDCTLCVCACVCLCVKECLCRWLYFVDAVFLSVCVSCIASVYMHTVDIVHSVSISVYM